MASVARASSVCAPLPAVIIVSMPLPLAVATCAPSNKITSVRIGCCPAAVASTCTLLLLSAAPLLGELMATVTVVPAGCVAITAGEPLLPTHPLSSKAKQNTAAVPHICAPFADVGPLKQERQRF